MCATTGPSAAPIRRRRFLLVAEVGQNAQDRSGQVKRVGRQSSAKTDG